jgi:hypothetical protein
LAVHPEATIWAGHPYRAKYRVMPMPNDQEGVFRSPLGFGETEDAAWKDAASKLPKPAEDAIRSATPEELTAQTWNYKPGPRQAVAFTPQDDARADIAVVWIDPRTKEPCRRCSGTGKMPPWPGSKGLVACGVCREEERAAPLRVESPKELPPLDVTLGQESEQEWTNKVLDCRERQLKQCMAENKRLLSPSAAVPVEERTSSMTKKCTCKHMHGHEGCAAAVDVSCGCVLHDDDEEERTAEMEQAMKVLRTSAEWCIEASGQDWEDDVVALKMCASAAPRTILRLLDHIEPKPKLSTESIQEVKE